jgi:DNA-binding LacI/PurR family transcriptional regulator
VAADPGLVVRGPHGREAAAALTRELLELPEPPTALFAASDTQAVGALEAAAEAGVPVPEDFSVVGYDDIELARYAGLTTIAQPLEESGVRGAELLLAALDGTATGGKQLSVELVIRSTTAEPGSKAGGSSARSRKVRVRERRGQARQDGKRVRS